MYNRYVRDDAGVSQRVPSGEPERPAGGGGRPRGGSGGILSQLLSRLKLEEVDTGDLLLLAILFLLFREGEDEELLLALGLLLIL